MRRSSLRSTPRKGEKEDGILRDASKVSSITITEGAVELLGSVAETPVIRRKWRILREDSIPSNITLSKTMAQKLEQTYHAPVERRSLQHQVENESSEFISSPEVRRPFQRRRKLVTRESTVRAFQAALSESANKTHELSKPASAEVSSEEEENSPLPNQALKKRRQKRADPSVFQAALRNSSQLSPVKRRSLQHQVENETSEFISSPEVRRPFQRRRKLVTRESTVRAFQAALSESANKTHELSKPASAEVSSEEEENSPLPNQALKKRRQKRADPSVFQAALRNSSQLSPVKRRSLQHQVENESSEFISSPKVRRPFQRRRKLVTRESTVRAFQAALSESANKTHELSKPASAEVSSEEEENSPLPNQALKKRRQKRADPSVFQAALRNSSQLSRPHSHDTSVRQEASSEFNSPEVRPHFRRLQKKSVVDKDAQAFKAALSESANKTHELSKPASAEVSSEEEENSPLPNQALKKRRQKRVDPSVFEAALRNSSQLSGPHTHDTSVQQESSSENMSPDVQPRFRRLKKNVTYKDTEAFKAILSESANKTHESSKPAPAEVSSEEDENSPLPNQALKKRIQNRVDPYMFEAALRNSSQLSRPHSLNVSDEESSSKFTSPAEARPHFHRKQKQSVTDKDAEAFKALLSESQRKVPQSAPSGSIDLSYKDAGSPEFLQPLQKRRRKDVGPSVFVAALQDSSQLSAKGSGAGTSDNRLQKDSLSKNSDPEVGKILPPAVALLQNLSPGKEENSPVLSQGIRKRRLAHADNSARRNILRDNIQPSETNTNTAYSQEAAKLPTPVMKVQSPKRHTNKKMELQDQIANRVGSSDSSIVPATVESIHNSSEEHLPFLRPKRPVLEPKSFEEDFENASLFSSSTKDLEPFPTRYLHRDRSFTPSNEQHLTTINQIHALGRKNTGDNLNNSIPRSKSQRQNVKATMEQKSVVSRNSHISHSTMTAENNRSNADGDHDDHGDISRRSVSQRHDAKAVTKQKSVMTRNSQISHSTMTAENNRSNADGDHDDHGDISRRSVSQRHDAKAVTKQKSVMTRNSQISHSTMTAENNRSNADGDHDDHGDISRRSVSQRHDAKAVTKQKSVMTRNSQISHSTMTAENNRSNADGDHDDHGDISRRSVSQRHDAKAVTEQNSVMTKDMRISHSTKIAGGDLKQLTIPSLFPKQITLAPRGTEERYLQMREFLRKFKQAEDEERRILRIQEEKKRERAEAPRPIVKKVVTTKKPTAKRQLNPIQAIAGKRNTRLKKPQYWATPRLYKLVIKHCGEKFGEIEAYRRAEEFVIWLCKQVQIVIRRKKVDNYRAIAENVKRGLFKLGIIKSLMDYFIFIENYLPFLYRIKVIPCTGPNGQVTGIQIPKGTDLFADLGL